jgi:2-keto-4-pentenoate hydratase/2-oxohepta-3-ene-1,7-dioic acid hydratase in catechol pathway
MVDLRHRLQRSERRRCYRSSCRFPGLLFIAHRTLHIAARHVETDRVAEHMIERAAQISKLSAAFELMPGDIIYSGTPENVGPVVKGDMMEGHIDALPDIKVKVV